MSLSLALLPWRPGGPMAGSPQEQVKEVLDGKNVRILSLKPGSRGIAAYLKPRFSEAPQLRRVTWKGGSRTHSLRLILMQVSVVVA